MSKGKLRAIQSATALGVVALRLGFIRFGLAQQSTAGPTLSRADMAIADNAASMLSEGRRIFRFDTFGDEDFWGGKLRLHEAVAGSKLGGVGVGLTPKLALSLGLKIDADMLPAPLIDQVSSGKLDVNDPANTVALLKLGAVIGLTGVFAPDGKLQSLGIQCALCHSTVDQSFSAPGVLTGLIGKRLDGWPNRDLNVGAIVALAPSLNAYTELLGVDDATVRKVLNSWGPGKFDAELILDGKAFQPDGTSSATLIPAAFGLAGVNLGTYTGWGSVTHWNAFVANLEMHGKGTFFDPRLNDAGQFPIAARAHLGNVRAETDLVTSKLGALHYYQLSIPAPSSGVSPFAVPAANRGRDLFMGKAKCAGCHVPPLYTEPGWNMHRPEEIGIDDFQANRSPDKRYRTTPLRGMIARQKGGFFHDGRFATMMDVINHYDTFFQLGLTADEKTQLVLFVQNL